MAIHYGVTPPPPFLVQADDVFVHQTTGAQQRFNGSAWVAIEARGDVLPRAGDSEQHLARGVVTRPFHAQWVVPSDGMVFQYDQPAANPSDEWEITHELRSRWVDVTVISPGASNPTAEQTEITPRVEYSNAQRCKLHFAYPVSGTALIRR